MLVPFADTDCDVTPEIAAEYGYRLISMPYSIDGKTIYPYEDFDVFESRKYYGMLRAFLGGDERDLRNNGRRC